MNRLHLSLVLTVVTSAALPALQAQTANQQELPSAPSATRQEENQRRQPPPAPAATTSAPAAAPVVAPIPAATPTDSKGGGTAAATASADQPPVDDPNYIFRKRVDEVNVIFTVTDKHGRFVKDLKQDDFKVLDDNKPPASVGRFRAETNLPLRVGLLVDASNSVRDRFTFEQEAAIEFLNQIIRHDLDRAFVIGFDTTAEVTQDFTDETEKLSKGVRALRAGGGTALYDALYYACRDKLRNADKDGVAVRKAIILLSDGEDNQSRVTREEAIEMAQRAEVIVYPISTNVSGVKLRGDKILERLADATGGRAFFPFKVQDVANAFSEIQDELRSQYVLAYKPADLQPDGRYHAIDITAQNKKNLKVRARKGYFAPKQ